MSNGALARATLGLLAAACALSIRPTESASSSTSSSSSASSRADIAFESIARADPSITTSCMLRGSGPVAKGTELFDQATAGRVIAKFTGAVSPLTLSTFPADPTVGRAHVSTSSGGAALRVDGWAQAAPFLVYAARDIAVAADHVWISSARKVRLVQATSTTLTGEVVVSGSANQAVRATAPCDAFTLQRGTARAIDVPGNGRLYANKTAELELFDAPGGALVFTLKMVDGGSVFFWSAETRGAFVHVLARGDLTIDAWAKATALDAQKRGEMIDQAAPAQTVVAGAQLALDGGRPPTVVVATKETPVRARRDDKEAPIGALEVGAEAYVMETMMGWVNLLPKHLGFTAGDGGGFWIPASELPHR